jgi:sugar phosphate isomerase/epimerase
MSLTDSKWLGINFDACNIHRAGYVESKGDSYSYAEVGGREDEVGVLQKVVGRVAHFHAKDYKNGACAPLGEGDVKLAECIECVKASGYSGAVSLETEGDEDFDTSRSFAVKGLAFLKEHVQPGA